MSNVIRLGVVGGTRGRGFGQSLGSLKGRMRLSAICDIHPGVREAWKNDFPGIDTFDNYERMLDSGTVDAVLIDLLFDPISPRPGNCAEHFITGTKACFHSHTPIPYPDGMRAGPAIAFAHKGKHGHYPWQPLMDMADQYEHPQWRRHLASAEKAGHGGGDYFILLDFANAILGRSQPAIDVYDAVLWSAFIELSARSMKTGKALPVPQFRPKGR